MGLLDFFNNANLDYIDLLYSQYRDDPAEVPEAWRSFFLGFDAGASTPGLAPKAEPAKTVALGKPEAAGLPMAALPVAAPDRYAESAADMVHSYRELGHLAAELDPLGSGRKPNPLLELSEFGFSSADVTRQVGSGGFLGATDGTLQSLLAGLKRTYCGTIGAEYMHIAEKEQRRWLQEQMEPALNAPGLSDAEVKRALFEVLAAERFEQFLQNRFLGQKRFSAEGGETLVPLLGALIETGAGLGVEEFVMGMAHRGRLNVLAHILRKPYQAIFSEFLGAPIVEEDEGEGDVKYHLGYRNRYPTSQGKEVSLYLNPNPSHLELVDPVVEGVVRAKQELSADEKRSRNIPVMIHGEAAFTGQGIVFETMSLSHLERYSTGGTIHIIVNNQLGFTATPHQTRFSHYPTEAAKLVHAPIFHVNGDDVEAAVHIAKIAMGFRQRFHRDVVIDLWCFRKYGHNETDDPTFTSPLMYKKIAKHPAIGTLFIEKLRREGRLTEADLTRMEEELNRTLETSLAAAKSQVAREGAPPAARPPGAPARVSVDSVHPPQVSLDTIRQISQTATRAPDGFHMHPKLKRLFEQRAEMAEGKLAADWGCAEMWAVGSCLLEGISVRLTGQDTERGTFSHRHAVLHDTEDESLYIPLQHLKEGQARFTVQNTMLSELAVLGFEYGFSQASPETLVMWEAQFGDFVNGAQPVIDQFIAAGEAKWQIRSGIVMLLPHGYEGQGPEHSSARLERFLQLSAENNIQVCQPSTAAQYFHLLRRQAHLPIKKPLVVMTPKSLLRLPASASPVEDFVEGGFRTVIADPHAKNADVRRVLLCSGKVYFALEDARAKRGQPDVAIVRVEQLYPFPAAELEKLRNLYPEAQEWVWVQDEPRNMGAFDFIQKHAREFLPSGSLAYCGRRASASPATGYAKQHEREEAALLRSALSGGTTNGTAEGALSSPARGGKEK